MMNIKCKVNGVLGPNALCGHCTVDTNMCGHNWPVDCEHQEIEAFKSRVFLDNEGQPRMAKHIDGVNGGIWVHSLHSDNKWITQLRITPDSAFFLQDNLSEKEQACYPPIL